MRRLCVFLLLLLLGCQHRDERTIYHGIQMCVPYKIIVGRADPRVSATIETVFAEIDTIFNQWNVDSEISQINRLPPGSVIEPSSSMRTFLPLVNEAVALSEGRFDPTVEPLVALWKESFAQGALPATEKIAEEKRKVGWHHLTWQGDLLRKKEQVQCNFDGIAKGYCVDRLIEELSALGILDLYVEWGGEIRTRGKHPEGRPWRIMVTGIGGRQEQGLEAIDLVDQAIASSGDYYQQWQIGEEVYTHIIDGTTGKALQVHEGGVASVTVLAPTCLLADALATSGMLFSSATEASAWAKRVQRVHPEVRFWIVER